MVPGGYSTIKKSARTRKTNDCGHPNNLDSIYTRTIYSTSFTHYKRARVERKPWGLDIVIFFFFLGSIQVAEAEL